MDRLSSFFSRYKRRSESRSLLPPRESWEHLPTQTESPKSPPCWPLLSWVTSRSRPTSACRNKDQGLRSKVHPLSSRVIRKRNLDPSRRAAGENGGRGPKEGKTHSSWSSPLAGLACGQPPHESRERKRRRTIRPKKWGIGLSVLDIWPTTSCRIASHAHNLQTIITTPSSWKWFRSSDTMLRNFLEDTSMVKNMDAKDLNEYRELLLNETLTAERLQHYPKLVLKVFVFLLRNREPPKNAKKKMLIELCTRWSCKNKNYFCSLESSTTSILRSGDELHPNDDTKTRPKTPRKPVKRGRDKEGNLDAYALGGFAAGSVYKDLVRSSTDSTKIKLENDSRFEEEEQLVSDEDKEDAESTYTNDDAESSSVTQDTDQTYCPCFACTSDDEFCYGCSCTICKDIGEIRDNVFWLKCKECAHMTHLQCAVRAGFVGYVPVRNLDGEYWCQSCGAKEDMVSYWKSCLKEASECDDRSRLEELLYCAMLVLKDTQRAKYKDLQGLVCEAWGQLSNDEHAYDARSLIALVCSDLNFSDRDHINAVCGGTLQNNATDCLKKAEEDIAGVNETIQEVEAWKTILSQTEEQLKRLELKLEVKTKSALLSRAAAMIAKKRLHETQEQQQTLRNTLPSSKG